MQRFYFTFGSSDSYPFQNSYIIVEAETLGEAFALFRSKWPDKTPDTLNCSFFYSEPAWEKAKANHNMKFAGTLRSEFIKNEDERTCCFCGKPIKKKNSHNAQPLKNAYCCEQCNAEVVAPAKISLALRKGN